MGDTFGGLGLPVAVPSVSDPSSKTLAAGDPALRVLGSFLATVLIAEVGEAAAVMWPGLPKLASEATLGAGLVPARRIFFSQPRPDRPFVGADLPALFIFRYGTGVERGKWEQLSSDTLRTQTPLMVWWMAAPEEPETEKFHDTFLFAIGSAMLTAANFGYHRSWVIDEDREKPASLIPRIATQTSAWTVLAASFTGQLKTTPMTPSRAVVIQTAVASGAYVVGAKIKVNGLDQKGRAWSSTVTITKANGGESLMTLWQFRTVTSIEFPAMATTAGAIVVGWAASPEAATGSRMHRHAGFANLLPKHPGELKTVTFRVGDMPVPYRFFEMVWDAVEDFKPDPVLRSIGPKGLDGSYVLPNGSIFANDVL